MKFLAPLALALTFLALPSISLADVLVYRGVFRSYSPTLGRDEARSQKCFVVIGDADPEGSFDVVILHYGKRGRTKRLVAEAKRNAYTQKLEVRRKTFTTFTFAEGITEQDGLAFRHSAIFLRGRSRNLVIANNPVVVRAVPRTISGVFRESTTSFVTGSDYVEANLSAMLDTGRTMAVNNAEKAFDDVVTDLQAQLNATGFQQAR